MGRASKDKRDMYYRKAKEEGYRARSAYKLLQLHEEFNILQRDKITTGVVDLCAAPGSWSQVLASHLREEINNNNNNNNNNISTSYRDSTIETPRIVAVDLQEMMPIDGVQLLQGDITSEATAREIIRLLNNNIIDNNNNNSNSNVSEKKADLVVCDGAPDVTGMHELDEYLQHHLLLAALNITTFVLRPGGSFVTKMFRGPNTPFLVAKSEIFFKNVLIAKPRSSRNASMEAFMVCQDYQPPIGYRPSFDNPLTINNNNNNNSHCFTPAAPPPPSILSVQQEYIENQQQEHITDENNNNNNNNKYLKNITSMEAVVVPFLACGDLTGYDADMCYDRDEEIPILPPVHPPRQAPYIQTTLNIIEDENADDGKRRRLE